MLTLENDAQLAAAVVELAAIESKFKAVVIRHGQPPLRHSDAGLKGLLRIVTDQLISLKAGEAIWRRLEAELSPFDPAALSQFPQENLMALGLSGAKARAFKAISLAVHEGKLQFARLDAVPDHDVLKALQAIKGIGPWTADIYLLSAMGRADAWPTGDLALQVAAQHLFGLPERPKPHDMMALAQSWRPWRAAAARLLWSHYRGLRGMPQTIA